MVWGVNEDLQATWSLDFADSVLLASKAAPVRLAFAAQLSMYRRRGRFARDAAEFPDEVLAYLAGQTATRGSDLTGHDWLGRTGRRHRAEILRHLGCRRATRQDLRDAAAWARAALCPLALPTAQLEERLLLWFVERQIVAPEREQTALLVDTAVRTFEDDVLAAVAAALSAAQKQTLDESLADEGGFTSFAALKADPGEPNIDSILVAAGRLLFVKGLALPPIGIGADDPVVRLLRRRVGNGMRPDWHVSQSTSATQSK